MKRPWDCRHDFRHLFDILTGNRKIKVFECRRCGCRRTNEQGRATHHDEAQRPFYQA